MTEAGTVRLWHTLSVAHADRMHTWLEAIGFETHAIYRDEHDSSVVMHGELLWPGGGGLMFGSHRPGNDLDQQVGSGACYLVHDDPDVVFDRAVAAGARVVRPMEEQGYGGRGGTVADPEGNTWSFGSYQPA